MSVLVIAAVALALGYLLGRLRPWHQLGNWAADQVRFTGSWVQAGTGRQTVVVLAHAVTAPRTTCRMMRTPATETQTPMPERDPNWVTDRTPNDKGGAA